MTNHLDVNRVYGRRWRLPALYTPPAARVFRAALFILGAYISYAIASVSMAQAAESLRIKVVLEGVHGDMKENVRALLTLEQFNSEKGIKAAVRSLTTFEGAPKTPTLTADELPAMVDLGITEIRKALAPFGYDHPKIESSVEPGEELWTVTYRIDPGPATVVANLHISVTGNGQHEPSIIQAAANFPLRQGDSFRDFDYDKGKGKILRAAQEAGYLEARWDQSVAQIRREQREADIVLALDTGPRFHFGPTQFSKDILREDVLNRFLPYHPGEPFSQDKLLQLQSALYDTDFFSSVQVIPQREQMTEDGIIPIAVDLKAQAQRQYTAGAGFATDTGPRASLGLKVRRVNDRGDHLRARYRWSEIKRSAEGSYIILGEKPRTDFLEVSSGWSDEKLPDGEEETYILGVSRTTGIWAGIMQTAYLNLSVESYVLGPDSGKTQLLTPGLRWTWLRSDSASYPRRGVRWTVETRGTDPALWSDAQFLQLQTTVKGVRAVAKKTRVLARLDVGRTFFSTLTELPPSMRYFAGGDQSVRGYDYQQLSVGNLGGTHLLVGSLEVEQQVAEKWSVAIFSDAGNAMQGWNTPLEQGTGVGGRWISPIGPLRLDVAWAVTEPGSPYRVHLTLGPDL